MSGCAVFLIAAEVFASSRSYRVDLCGVHVVEGCGCSCGGGAVETMFPVWAYFAMVFRVTLSLRNLTNGQVICQVLRRAQTANK